MSCVEGAVTAQVPGPNQYWEHIKSKDRAYFIGRDPDGMMVFQCEGDAVEVGNLDWSGWRHIPGCTGWDWEPNQVEEYPQYWTTLAPPPTSIAYLKRIDQSTLVSVHKDGTEVKDSVIEWKTNRRTRLTEQEALALLDKPVPAETWPQYYINRDPGLKWYIRAENHRKIPKVYLPDGSIVTSQANWDDIESSLSRGIWIKVTEAEARARIAVDKAPAEVWPKYYVPTTAIVTHRSDSPVAYFRRDRQYVHDEANGETFLIDGASFVWNEWTQLDNVQEVTEAEAKARVTKAAEPTIEVQFLPVAPEMDWVVQDRVPARNNVDEWCWCKRGSSPGYFYSGFGGWSGDIRHGHIMGDEVLHLRCRRKDLPEIAPEMEWVELPCDHVLRRDVDWIRTIGPWQQVLGLAGRKVSDLPLKLARCLRKDLPVIESPEDWVVQDRVEARPGIDQGWWSYAEPNVDKSKWSWWTVANSGGASGRKHGHVHEDGQMLNLRCKRKDLPPVPAPVEETFPQWYILKDDEKRSWVPDWTVKRTGEETSIRYARDEAGELYATNEPWTGAPDCWERCSEAESIVRMGTLMFPRVPSEPRRVPVKLWVTYRLNDEGGDWPVRATQADQTCQNWKEIKFDGNGAFIEVEQ